MAMEINISVIVVIIIMKENTNSNISKENNYIWYLIYVSNTQHGYILLPLISCIDSITEIMLIRYTAVSKPHTHPASSSYSPPWCQKWAHLSSATCVLGSSLRMLSCWWANDSLTKEQQWWALMNTDMGEIELTCQEHILCSLITPHLSLVKI